MNNATRLAIFRAQVENVRELTSARTQIRRVVNDALRRGHDSSAAIQTKILALLFCAWAEANFLKVIYTPYGFTLPETQEIRNVWATNGISEGWKKCLQLGLRKVPAQKSNFVPNARQRLLDVVQEYVTEPTLIRNKIAHGQWKVALNKNNTDLNSDITATLATLNVVTIEIWFECHRRLAQIIESLIESPERTFLRDYWPQLVELDEFIARSNGWSLSEKIARMKAKKKGGLMMKTERAASV